MERFDVERMIQMKIFVVGANGQIGRHLIKDLAPSSHEIFAGVRDVASQTLVKKENVSYVSFDLTWSVEKMTEAFKGIDVLIFAAGRNALAAFDAMTVHMAINRRELQKIIGEKETN